jgi:hypothetical protein
MLRFAVTDTGIGLAPEELDRLFKPFSQAKTSTTRHYGGSGLGLYLVGQLATLMGGRCGASSKPGQGSEFWFTAALPRSTDEDAFASAIPEAAVMDALRQRHAGRRVMLVEDDPLGREVAAGLLGAVGLEPVLVHDGAAALQRATVCTDLALVLTDLNLPDMDGWPPAEVLRAADMRQHLPHRGHEQCRDHRRPCAKPGRRAGCPPGQADRRRDALAHPAALPGRSPLNAALASGRSQPGSAASNPYTRSAGTRGKALRSLTAPVMA